MKRSNRLVLLIGVFLAVVAFVGIALTLGDGDGPGPATSVAPTQLPTVIAAQDIPLGAVVTGEMLKVQDLPIDQRKLQSFQNPGQVIGKIARRAITTDAQLEVADFSVTNLTQIDVPPGMRAYAVQVDQVTGVGTIIRAGDYVDMIIGLTGDRFPVVEVNPDDDTITVVAGLNGTSVKLLIEGMQVLGTALPATPAADPNAPAPSGEPATTLTGNQELVILAVSAQQAEIIKFAQMDGSITLALRSPKDFVDESGNPIVVVPSGTTGVILKTLVDGYGVIRPELVEAILPTQ
ncbi:MAG TPA: Flp pilus assembly protein CpaB [Candidatus Limnocylindrales bacterium]|nr:Flp pilus assembly protein CpaB [Candidatus Limnocylindrales bacterium]